MIQMSNQLKKNLSRSFNTRIKIKRISKKIVNGRHEEVEEDYFSCWCNPKDFYGKELYEAINIKFQHALNFETRYCNKIRLMIEEMVKKEARFQVEYGNCKYEIFYIDFKNNSKDVVVIKSNGVT